jgi:hypothetical protein
MAACVADSFRRARLLGAAAVLAIAAGEAPAAPRQRTAQTRAEAPLPPARPDAARPPEAAPGAPAPVPSPPPRPSDLASDGPAPSPPRPGASAQTASAAPEQDPAEDERCRARLAKLGVRFEPLPAISQGQCGAPYPLLVSWLPDGLEVSPPATLVCPVAEALARWSLDVVSVEASRHFEAPPVRIAIGTSYECRSQNRAADAKLSEHAYANAVDVMSFTLGKGKLVPVGESHAAESPEGRFQAAVRSGACSYFTTVLGPGSDAAHATHLHLDLRSRNRGYRMCQ